MNINEQNLCKIESNYGSRSIKYCGSHLIENKPISSYINIKYKKITKELPSSGVYNKIIRIGGIIGRYAGPDSC